MKASSIRSSTPGPFGKRSGAPAPPESDKRGKFEDTYKYANGHVLGRGSPLNSVNNGFKTLNERKVSHGQYHPTLEMIMPALTDVNITEEIRLESLSHVMEFVMNSTLTNETRSCWVILFRGDVVQVGRRSYWTERHHAEQSLRSFIEDVFFNVAESRGYDISSMGKKKRSRTYVNIMRKLEARGVLRIVEYKTKAKDNQYG